MSGPRSPSPWSPGPLWPSGRVWSLALLAATLVLSATLARAADPASAGRRLFEEGILPSGRPLQALVTSDVRMSGRSAACANCHRPTGLGSLEGAVFTPPIAGGYRPSTATFLVPGPLQLRLEFRAPKYTPPLFARAVRDGIAPSGLRLGETMPRYTMDDEAMRVLVAYVRSLPGPLSPGASDGQIDLATVVDLRIPEERRRTFLQVLERYLVWRNREMRPLATPTDFPTSQAPRLGREWKLHVWTVDGPQDGWAAQLARQYREQPVFAVVSGLVQGPWSPVATFCETAALPCLFPVTDLPPSAPGRFSMYFSRGLALDADLIARHLVEQGAKAPSVLQAFTDDEVGRAAARELAAAFGRAGLGAPRDVPLTAARPLAPQIIGAADPDRADAWLIAWLDASQLEALTPLASHFSTIFLSSSLIGASFSSVPPAIRPQVLLSHQFYDPGVPFGRTQAGGRDSGSMFLRWEHSAGIVPTDERLQTSAYSAAMILEDGLMHIGENLYRTFLLEALEHDLDASQAPTIYPRLTLGPGQRFASKEGLILGFASGSSAVPHRVAGPMSP